MNIELRRELANLFIVKQPRKMMFTSNYFQYSKTKLSGSLYTNELRQIEESFANSTSKILLDFFAGGIFNGIRHPYFSCCGVFSITK